MKSLLLALLAIASLALSVTAFAQQTGGRGVPTSGGGVNCGGVPGGTSTTGCGGVPGGSGSAIPAAIHFWPMNEGAGSTFVDHVGSTNLTASNVTWAVSSGLGSSAVAQFNGTTSSAVASAVDSTLNFNGTSPMSIAFWVFPVSNNPATFAGNLETASEYQGWEATLDVSTGLLVVNTVTTNQMSALGTTALATNTATFVVMTYTGSLNAAGVSIYIDGVAQTVTDQSGTLTAGATSTQPFIMGARGNATSFYDGGMAYMRVWNQVLMPTQVSALYALGPQ
jgi:Concanavalin A-like lectin/glucanases superfamily